MAEMIKTDHKLLPPSQFNFPFTPYPIQHDFMTALYSTIESGKLGIFESPTGTGKSLSITCGALQWLKDHESRQVKLLTEHIESLTILKNNRAHDDWIEAQYQEMLKANEKTKLQLQLDAIKKQDELIKNIRSKRKMEKLRPKWLDNKLGKDTENVKQEMEGLDCEDDDFLLEDFLEQDLVEDEEPEEQVGIKILFCSRTHSQLSQVVGEISRSPHSDVRVASLASRQSYCVNANARKLGDTTAINEKCLEMQKNKSGSKTTKTDEDKIIKRKKTNTIKSCEYYNQKNIESLKEETIIHIKDVEDLITSGKKMKACPYYTSRASIKLAQFIALPYQMLLHKRTRETSGIIIKNNVVIIDEAHNLLDTIAAIHSCQISLPQLRRASEQIMAYQNKYSTRFSPKNYLWLSQLIFITKRLITVLDGDKNESRIFKVEDFVMSAEFDNINIFPLLEFCERSRLAQKLQGFAQQHLLQVNVNEKQCDTEKGVKAFLKKIELSDNSKKKKLKSKVAIAPTSSTPKEIEPVADMSSDNLPLTNCLYPLLALLERLTEHCEDGRLLVTKGNLESKCSIKYLLLNPGAHFQDIVREARSVIVAGGTMQPTTEFSSQLFGVDLDKPLTGDRITQFSCNHVVPPESLCPVVLSVGPSRKSLLFNYANRTSKELLDELGMILQNICSVVPGGVVCFFPSYDYEQLVYNHLLKNNNITKLETKKKIFREPRLSNQVDKILDQYSSCIKHTKNNHYDHNNISQTGALLFSVVGGKLSEGLNFSDDLGRCVIVVGLPYPNKNSPELSERIGYLNNTVGNNAGNVYYDNLCFKSVNQCIGRAIRHINDYAAIVLLDERFGHVSSRSKLSNWIQKSLKVTQNYGQAHGMLARFFAGKKPVHL